MNTQSIFNDNLLFILFLLILKISRGTEIVYCVKHKNAPRGTERHMAGFLYTHN